MLADGQADFVIDLTDDMSQAENYGYKLTDSYLSAEFPGCCCAATTAR